MGDPIDPEGSILGPEEAVCLYVFLIIFFDQNTTFGISLESILIGYGKYLLSLMSFRDQPHDLVLFSFDFGNLLIDWWDPIHDQLWS